MYFVPLSQLESVELLVHSLKAAAGEADCTMCPARKVCMKQCLTIANSVEQMLQSGTIPQLSESHVEELDTEADIEKSPVAPKGKSGLRVVK